MSDHIRELIQHVVLYFTVTEDDRFGDVVCGVDFYEKVEDFG